MESLENEEDVLCPKCGKSDWKKKYKEKHHFPSLSYPDLDLRANWKIEYFECRNCRYRMD